MQCKICGSSSDLAFQGKVLRKYDVSYYRCIGCGFLQTEEPYWLAEAYSSAISDTDLGPVNRAVTGAQIVESLILLGFDPNARFIDWGGGYGVFTRLMRDIGYDFYWRDAYCQNLFAKQFVANDSGAYELMTSFEVFEHLAQPMSEIEAMLKLSPSILFTTQLPPARLEGVADWWYLAPENGQYIAIYSLPALNHIAKTFGLNLNSDGSAFHLLSPKTISDKMFRIIALNGRASKVIRSIQRRKLRKGSLLMDDFRAVTGWDV